MISFRKAEISDLEQYFKWANDEEVRRNSFNQQPISLKDHTEWFSNKIQSDRAHLLLFYLDQTREVIGQVRLDKTDNRAVIGISLDKVHRGKGFAPVMLQMACRDFLEHNPGYTIQAYIKPENIASYRSFIKAGFGNTQQVNYLGTNSLKLIFNDSTR